MTGSSRKTFIVLWLIETKYANLIFICLVDSTKVVAAVRAVVCKQLVASVQYIIRVFSFLWFGDFSQKIAFLIIVAFLRVAAFLRFAAVLGLVAALGLVALIGWFLHLDVNYAVH